MDQNIQHTVNFARRRRAANNDCMGSATSKRSGIKQQHKELKLFAYAMNGEIEKLKSLVLAGVDVNATSVICHSPLYGKFGGNTALMFAASAGNRDAVALLLKHGANPSACNLVGDTAHTLALLNKDHDMANLLKSRRPVQQQNKAWAKATA